MSESLNLDTSLSAAPQDPAPEPVNSEFPMSFTGDTGEYFRIWIVNTCLSIVTLGLYVPWARVRTRRYFHAHSHLDGHSFDYLAKPVNILWGYLIMAAVFAAYQLAGIFNPVLTIPILGVGAIAAPWVMFKAMRFKARNTSYRNVRFEFHGTIGESYVVFLGLGLLTVLTFGILSPYWIMKQKEYFYRNLSFGGKRFLFGPEAGQYYGTYIVGGLVSGLLIAVSSFLFAGIITAAGTFDVVPGGGLSVGLVVLVALAYIPMIGALIFGQTYIYVSIFNYNLERLVLDDTEFKSNLQIGKFFWITFSNVLASVVSLGLLVPWARVRRAKYLADSVALINRDGSLGEHVAEPGEEVSSIGDAAADAFEFEIGW